jgi:hypothetical protein
MIDGAKFCVVTWHDAHADSHWQELTDIDDEPYAVQTCGWLLPGAKKDHVVIAQSISCDDSIDGLLYIPVGMVVGMKLLGS